MAAPLAKNAVDTEIHVTYADQQKINKFARFNARLHDFEEELKEKQKEKENLEEAGQQLEELFLLDDEIKTVPYQVGEVFVHASSDDTNEMLEKAKKKIDADIAELEEKRAAHVETLKDLKVQLYAKFGTNINLEADD